MQLLIYGLATTKAKHIRVLKGRSPIRHSGESPDLCGELGSSGRMAVFAFDASIGFLRRWRQAMHAIRS